MIQLSGQQAAEYGVPLIKMCMDEESGRRAEESFTGDEEGPTGLYGLFDKDVLTCIAGIGAEISRKKVWLGYLAVHPAYRHQGLGSRCLLYAEEEAKSRGYCWIFVETYDSPIFESAVRLYKQKGYKQIGELPEYLDDGSDALYLRKELL